MEEALPVGGREIAGRLGVKPQTVAMWKLRGLLPVARWTVSGEDAWDWSLDIVPWAQRTRRLKSSDSQEDEPREEGCAAGAHELMRSRDDGRTVLFVCALCDYEETEVQP